MHFAWLISSNVNNGHNSAGNYSVKSQVAGSLTWPRSQILAHVQLKPFHDVKKFIEQTKV